MGGATCVLCLALEAAMQARFLSTNNKSGLAAGVAFFYFFAYCYNFFYDAGSFVYTAEIWPSHLRSEGTTIAMVTFYTMAIAYNTPASLAFASIGWKYYLVFVVIATLSTVVLYLVLPETAGLTLEELGMRFGEVPVVKFEDINIDALEGEEAVVMKREA